MEKSAAPNGGNCCVSLFPYINSLALLVSKYDAKNPGSIFSGDD
jgi:hypothetical protein